MIAERAVIGSVLLDQTVLPFAMAELKPTDFADPDLETIWDGILRMRSAGEPIDTITVSGNLSKWGVKRLQPADLWNLIGEVPHAHAVSEYAKQVREASLRRSLIHAGRMILENAETIAPGEVIANSINTLRDIQQGTVGNDITAKPLMDVLQGVDEYDWVIPNLLERKDRFILTGTEGAGKSTFVRQLAVLSAAGIHPTTFTRIKPVKVLVVDAENTEQQWRRATRYVADRAARLGSVDPRLRVHLACSPRLDITKDSDLGQVHRLVDEHEPDILFIGPLYRLTSKAINSDDDAAPLLTALDTLRDRNVCLVMEAHAGHAVGVGGERELRPRGSSALLGWPEFGMGIRVQRDDPSTFSLVRWRGDRDQREWPRLMRRGGEWPWTPTEL